MNYRSGYVTLIGKPNVGKSTLMNKFLGSKLSIVTSKPQTTRKRILGIVSEDDYQIIFLDTPGILNPSYLLQQKFLDYVTLSVNDADIILLIIDISNDRDGTANLNDDKVRKILNEKKCYKICVLNKIDLGNEQIVKNLIDNIEKTNLFNSIIPVSASTGFNLESLKSEIIDHLPVGPKYYPDDQLTDETERFFVTEIIREKIFEFYKEEVPFSTEVVIDEFKEQPGRKDYISASIIVERETQKPIIIGKGGESIKRLGKIAREEIEKFIDRGVFLELFVKVKQNWRDNPKFLKSFGYDTGSDEK